MCIAYTNHTIHIHTRRVTRIYTWKKSVKHEIYSSDIKLLTRYVIRRLQMPVSLKERSKKGTVRNILAKKGTVPYPLSWNASLDGYPYLHDASANKNVHVSNASRTTHPETHLETLVCVLELVAVRFALWTMMAELCFSVDDFILDFFSNAAADTASEYDSYGHRRC